MEQEKKTAPQERGAERLTLADLLDRKGQTIETVAEAMNVDFVTVMKWVCGKIPESHETIKLHRILNCKLSVVWQAILNTPNLMPNQDF